MPRAKNASTGSAASQEGIVQSADSPQSLREEVREALLTVLRDHSAPAMAKASAGRTLIEMSREDDATPRDHKPAVEMTEDEIDSELSQLKRPCDGV